MKYAILALLFLGACAQVDAVRAGAKFIGAEAADRVLEDSAFMVCYGATIGAVRRAYGQQPGVYRDFCQGASDADLIGE